MRVLEARRAELNAGTQAAPVATEKLSFTHLIAWALVQGTKQFPNMGTSVLQSGAETYKIVADDVSLGLAVDVERKDGSRGLVVPVLKRAGDVSASPSSSPPTKRSSTRHGTTS